GETQSTDLLRRHPVAAFCGIGNPRAFRRTLVDLGVQPIRFDVYPDHHPYNRADVEEIAARARSLPEGTILVTTQKDLVKLRIGRLGERGLWALRIRLAFRAGQEPLEALLEGVLPKEGG